MNRVNRRNFIKKGIQGTAAITVGLSIRNLYAIPGKQKVSGKGVSVNIPRPIQVVIDDVGWWSGEDGSEWQEPYRTGINRNHVVADYKAIVALGKALGIRPQAATILGEWDKKNILRRVPHSTWMGKKWDNSKWVGPWLEEAADVINSNKENFELTMHGLGHEWWTDGKFTRAEWADNAGVMRPKEDIERHLDAFAEIMRQNNLGELPKSFVPTAFRHGFGVTPGNEVSIAELLKKRGFTYINTPFVIMRNKDDVQHDLFGIDSGILTVDRGNDLLDWDMISARPEGVIKGSTCGMHWPNLLHEDSEKNMEIVDSWVKLLAPYNDKPETMLAKNSVIFQQQLVHYKCSKTEIQDGIIKLDFTESNKLDTITSNEELSIKITSNRKLDFSSDSINIVSVSSKKKDASILYVLDLKKKDDKAAMISFR